MSCPYSSLEFSMSQFRHAPDLFLYSPRLPRLYLKTGHHHPRVPRINQQVTSITYWQTLAVFHSTVWIQQKTRLCYKPYLPVISTGRQCSLQRSMLFIQEGVTGHMGLESSGISFSTMNDSLIFGFFTQIWYFHFTTQEFCLAECDVTLYQTVKVWSIRA